MDLRELLGERPAGVEVADLAFDNRAVQPGTLFFCVPGFTRDGHDFAPDAVARGAVALVVARPLGLGVPEVLVDDVRAAMAVGRRALRRVDPTARLRTVGITGTNGKTTTAFLMRDLLEAAACRPACSGPSSRSSAARSARSSTRRPRRSICSAPSREMLAAGDEACAMEVSSHALELRRADAIHWAVAVFTNLTQDHLDFHPDMEAYFQAKRRLFEAADAGARIVNVDDPYGRRLAEEFDCVTFGLDDERRLRAGSRSAATCGSRCRGASTLNALGALAAARALGVDARRRRRVGARRARAGPLRAGRRRPALHGARRLRAHAGLARQRAAGGARAGRRRPRDLRLRRRRRPRPRQAAADGGDRRAAGRRRDRDLRQPALGGPRGDPRRDRGRHARRRTSARSTAARRSRGRSSWPSRATSS